MQEWWPRRPQARRDLRCATGRASNLDTGCIASLDLSLAFDSLDPEVPLALFDLAGMPCGVTAMLRSIWGQQERYLEYDGRSTATSEHVSSSVPQGDAWSVLAMVIALTPAMADLSARFPDSILRTYMDDRLVVSHSAEEMRQVTEGWGVWAADLGLTENHAKAEFFHASAAGRRALKQEGYEPSLAPKILGMQLQGRQKRKMTKQETDRLNKVLMTLKKCRYLPVTWGTRKGIIAGSAMAAWGWMFRRPLSAPLKKL